MKLRQYSKTGFENIIIRGIARGDIFYDDEDRGYFLAKMYHYAQKCGIGVIGYALLKNHVRLQLKVSVPSQLSEFIKRLCISYVRHYFNVKYDRNGSLFQNRFINEGFSEEDILKVNKILLDSCPVEKAKQKVLETSLKNTLKAFEDGIDLVLSTGLIRQRYTKEEYQRFISGKQAMELAKTAYTPNMKDILSYIARVKKDYGAEYGLSSEQIRTVTASLINNKVPIRKIARVMDISYRNVKRYLCRI